MRLSAVEYMRIKQSVNANLSKGQTPEGIKPQSSKLLSYLLPFTFYLSAIK